MTSDSDVPLLTGRLAVLSEIEAHVHSSNFKFEVQVRRQVEL